LRREGIFFWKGRGERAREGDSLFGNEEQVFYIRINYNTFWERKEASSRMFLSKERCTIVMLYRTYKNSSTML